MLNPEDLKELEELGAVFLPIPDCAILLEVSEQKLRAAIKDYKSEEAKHYNRGWLRSEIIVRRNIIDYANRGSSKAQQDSLNMITDMKRKN